MRLLERSTVPNAITVGRILLAPLVFALVLSPGFWDRLLAFLLFLLAAFSDIWDGHLARKYGWISDFGKLLDPIADKLLLVATFIPFYMLSRSSDPVGPLPFIGALPLWIVLVIFGRELAVTVIRAIAARRGVVIPAGRAGKHKTVFQSIFIGAVLAWYALQTLAQSSDWRGTLWSGFETFHGLVIIVTLLIALLLTVYSFALYLWRWRLLVRSVG